MRKRQWVGTDVFGNAWRGQAYPGQLRKIEINSQYGKVIHIMSGVLWCDKGEHPFSVKDVNKQHFVNTHTEPVLTGNSYGNPTYQQREQITEEIDICGPHWLNDNPFQTPETPAIEVAEAEAAESEAEMWKAKYEAEHAKNNRPTPIK
jgi:hypothetical protein